MGTSAGSIFAALTAAEVHPHRLLPRGLETLETLAEESAADDDWVLLELNQEASYRFPRALPVPVPGSAGLFLKALREPLKALSGLAPAGKVSTGPIRRTIRREVPSGWTAHPNCWVVACDYATGERVAFGRQDAPPAELADAVAASCAIPGFFKPVRIGDRQYVDGGLHSMSNLDLFEGLGLDLVICLNPLSSRAGARGWHPLTRVSAALRTLATRQIDAEVGRLLEEGTSVIVIEPTPEDQAVIGDNMMDARRCLEVVRIGLRTVTEQLRDREVRELLAMLPGTREERARKPSRVGSLLRTGLGAAAAL